MDWETIRGIMPEEFLREAMHEPILHTILMQIRMGSDPIAVLAHSVMLQARELNEFRKAQHEILLRSTGLIFAPQE